MIRIANAQGFWGDSIDAPVDMLRREQIGYLTLDYLAEVTMSILQKQRSRDPRAGYARDFIGVLEQGAHDIVKKNIKVLANAGGVNPEACSDAAVSVFQKAGYGGRVKVGMVAGDDILDRLDDLLERGIELRNMDTGEPLSKVRSKIRSANAYLGAFPIVEALRKGADVVITGRCADAALSLGPTICEFGWGPQDWDLLAAGLVAGHVIECGAQCTGGNCQYEWETMPDYAGIGYPIVEAEPDGTFVVTKPEGSGGRVTVPGVTEQLVYEIGDPRCYITPDVIVDFTSVKLKEIGKDRVHFSGVKGRPATEFYKVSISYSAGYKAVGMMVYGWPDAYKKAKAADQALRARLDRLGLKFDTIHSEYVGANGCHGDLLSGAPSPDIAEVILRVGVRGTDKAALERFSKEIAPLVLNGPPVVTYLAGGRPKVEEVVAYWPALIPKSEVKPKVTVKEA
jgi:hypothetical protein